MHTDIILASASPRRKEILTQIGFDFTVMTSQAEEKEKAALAAEPSPVEKVKILSELKGRDVFERLLAEGRRDFLVIGADTVVSIDDEILEKPVDLADAKYMISRLQGRVHTVYTGVTLFYADADGKTEEKTFVTGSEVEVYPMTEEEILWYIHEEEPYDKAGSYAIQGVFKRFIKNINGDYDNIVGLPAGPVYHAVKEMLQEVL